MNAVVWKFMRAARERFDLHSVEMIEGYAAFSYRIGLLHRFHHISFRQGNRFDQTPPSGKLRRNRRGEGASGAMRVFYFYAITAQLMDFRSVKEHVHGFFHVAALDDGRFGAHLHDL